MNSIGYCVTFNGKPVGIVGIGQQHALRTSRTYKARDPSARVEICPVFVGEPVTVAALPVDPTEASQA